MKVILTAFHGKLQSEVMDFPERTRPEIEMIMDVDTSMCSYQEETTPEASRLKKARFVWDGKTTFMGVQEVRHYKLIDIS